MTCSNPSNTTRSLSKRTCRCIDVGTFRRLLAIIKSNHDDDALKPHASSWLISWIIEWWSAATRPYVRPNKSGFRFVNALLSNEDTMTNDIRKVQLRTLSDDFVL